MPPAGRHQSTCKTAELCDLGFLGKHPEMVFIIAGLSLEFGFHNGKAGPDDELAISRRVVCTPRHRSASPVFLFAVVGIGSAKGGQEKASALKPPMYFQKQVSLLLARNMKDGVDGNHGVETCGGKIGVGEVALDEPGLWKILPCLMQMLF